MKGPGKDKNIQKKSPHGFSCGLRDSRPIALGYLGVSFAFGIFAAQGGMSALLAGFFSLSNVTSAGQVAGLKLIFQAAPYIEMVVITLVINARYLLMSLSLSQKLSEKLTLAQRLKIGFGVTDEIFAVAVSKPGKLDAAYMYGLILPPVLCWTAGTVLGATAGDILPGALTSALGIAVYCMFIAIIVPPARKERPVLYVVLLAIALSCLFRYVPVLSRLSGGWATIVCAVAASLFGAVVFPRKEAEEGGRAQ